MSKFSRRDLLQFAALGAAAPLAADLALVGRTAAAAAPSGYRALVCVFLQGGNDANNLLLATDADTWGRYWAARWRGTDPIALMPPGTAPVAIGSKSSVTGRTVTATDNPEYWGGVLPITPATAQAWPAGTQPTAGGAARTFAINPLMPLTQSLFSQGSLGFLANVGPLLSPLTKAQYLANSPSTPPRLYSHSDQQATWQSGQVAGTGASGWGGLIADAESSVSPSGVDFISITTAGGVVYPAGKTVNSYRVNVTSTGAAAQLINVLQKTGTYNGSPLVLSALAQTILPNTSMLTNILAADYADIVARSVQTAKTFSTAIAGAAGVAPAPTAFTNPLNGKVVDNPLADQLYAVATTMAASSTLAVNRQVFFVQLGGFDTHDGENSRQSLLLAQLDHALNYFAAAMKTMGLDGAVTTFTASDFNRTFTTNGDGTDHAWGSHHIVMGSAVKGGDIYGQYPTLGIDTTTWNNPNAVGNALIPTTSADQYLATLATWLGVPAGSLPAIFPNLANFPTANLGFMTP